MCLWKARDNRIYYAGHLSSLFHLEKFAKGRVNPHQQLINDTISIIIFPPAEITSPSPSVYELTAHFVNTSVLISIGAASGY